jgi:hypothetical protein
MYLLLRMQVRSRMYSSKIVLFRVQTVLDSLGLNSHHLNNILSRMIRWFWIISNREFESMQVKNNKYHWNTPQLCAFFLNKIFFSISKSLMLRSKIVNYLPGNTASDRVQRSVNDIFSDYKMFNDYDRRRVDGRFGAAAT